MKTRINSRRHRMGTGYSRTTTEEWAHYQWVWSAPVMQRHLNRLERLQAAGVDWATAGAICRRANERAWAKHWKALQAAA